MLDMWIRTFLTRSTGEKEIQLKLLKKGFSKEMISKKIEQYHEEIHDWQNQRQDIESRIENLIKKGKSSQSITMLFGTRYPYFRNEIQEFLSSQSDQ